MKWLPSDRPLLDAAMSAFRSSDWLNARRRLEEATGTGRADAGAFALLASACQRLDDDEAAHAAANRALAMEPRQLRALLVKADILAAKGELRDANVLYGGAEAAAELMPSIAPDLVQGVSRARAFRQRLQSEMEDYIRAELASVGYRETSSERRFTYALDVLTGRKTLYQQQPRFFYYPGLPTVGFYPREDFPWLDAVEAATDVIAEELAAVLNEDIGFVPYVQSQPNSVPHAESSLRDSLNWSSCFLWKDGVPTPHADQCSRTMEVLDSAPLCEVPGRSPLIMFSQLKPGARITPHTGVVNTRLLCHVPLVVPSGCRFRVGGEEREWEKGKAWVFNDTVEHEAHNSSDRTRVILIFDIWRPELNEDERVLISTLLQAMDAFAPDVSWE